MLPRFLNPLLRKLRPYYVPLISRPRIEGGDRDLFPAYIDSQDVVLEVGARIGGGTMLLSRLAKQVYSFEPNPYNYLVLKKYLKDFTNVSAFNAALGNRDGLAQLHLCSKHSLSAMGSINRIEGGNYDTSLEVKMITIDSFCSSLRKNDESGTPFPSALVMDCEGSELQVLQGGRRTIPLLSKILIETHRLEDGHDTTPDIVKKLNEYGFADVDDSYKESALQWVIATNPNRREIESTATLSNN